MIKYIFDLEVSDNWPPVDAESLWLEKADAGYIIRTIPYFIRNISLGDIVEIEQLDNARAKLIRIVEQSENSTIWLYFKSQFERVDEVLTKLSAAGIVYEGGGIAGYYALTLYPDIPLRTFDSIIIPYESSGWVEIVYGAMRHKQ